MPGLTYRRLRRKDVRDLINPVADVVPAGAAFFVLQAAARPAARIIDRRAALAAPEQRPAATAELHQARGRDNEKDWSYADSQHETSLSKRQERRVPT